MSLAEAPGGEGHRGSPPVGRLRVPPAKRPTQGEPRCQQPPSSGARPPGDCAGAGREHACGVRSAGRGGAARACAVYGAGAERPSADCGGRGLAGTAVGGVAGSSEGRGLVSSRCARPAAEHDGDHRQHAARAGVHRRASAGLPPHCAHAAAAAGAAGRAGGAAAAVRRGGGHGGPPQHHRGAGQAGEELRHDPHGPVLPAAPGLHGVRDAHGPQRRQEPALEQSHPLHRAPRRGLLLPGDLRRARLLHGRPHRLDAHHDLRGPAAGRGGGQVALPQRAAGRRQGGRDQPGHVLLVGASRHGDAAAARGPDAHRVPAGRRLRAAHRSARGVRPRRGARGPAPGRRERHAPMERGGPESRPGHVPQHGPRGDPLRAGGPEREQGRSHQLAAPDGRRVLGSAPRRPAPSPPALRTRPPRAPQRLLWRALCSPSLGRPCRPSPRPAGDACGFLAPDGRSGPPAGVCLRAASLLCGETGGALCPPLTHLPAGSCVLHCRTLLPPLSLRVSLLEQQPRPRPERGRATSGVVNGRSPAGLWPGGPDVHRPPAAAVAVLDLAGWKPASLPPSLPPSAFSAPGCSPGPGLVWCSQASASGVRLSVASARPLPSPRWCQARAVLSSEVPSVLLCRAGLPAQGCLVHQKLKWG